LLEYLIKTYSNVGDTILDCTMGSGSTGVAAINTNRQFIGIERDDKYFAIARTRIEAASPASLLSEMIDIESKPNAPEDKAA
jgi:DNA modification methylase